MRFNAKSLASIAVATSVLAACGPGARSHPAPLLREFANRIAVDSRGVAWVDIGHPYHSMWDYNGTQWSEVPILEVDTQRVDLLGMRDILADGAGHVYALANNRCCLFEYDGTTWRVLADRNLIGMMDAIAVDPDGRLWVAGHTGNTDTPGVTYITALDDAGWIDPYVLPTDSFATALAIGANGTMWAGTYAGELFALDTSRITSNPLVAPVAVTNDGASALTVDRANRVWVGGERGALYLVDQDVVTELWAPTTSNGNIVRVITCDTAGRTWAIGPNCTQLEDCKGPGLTVFDGATPRRFTRENSALPTNGLNDLAFDGSGGVWLATRSGVFVMSVTDLLDSLADSTSGG